MNKQGFTDPDVWMSPGVIILTILGWAALIIGWVAGKKMGLGALPTWQIVIVLIVIPFAAYFFATRE